MAFQAGDNMSKERDRRQSGVWGEVRRSLMLLQAVKMENRAGRGSPAKSCKPKKANIIRPNIY